MPEYDDEKAKLEQHARREMGEHKMSLPYFVYRDRIGDRLLRKREEGQRVFFGFAQISSDVQWWADTLASRGWKPFVEKKGK